MIEQTTTYRKFKIFNFSEWPWTGHPTISANRVHWSKKQRHIRVSSEKILRNRHTSWFFYHLPTQLPLPPSPCSPSKAPMIPRAETSNYEFFFLSKFHSSLLAKTSISNPISEPNPHINSGGKRGGSSRDKNPSIANRFHGFSGRRFQFWPKTELPSNLLHSSTQPTSSSCTASCKTHTQQKPFSIIVSRTPIKIVH